MDRPLRVVMPALTYVPGAMGGSETYARALVANLDQRDDVDLTVVVSRAGAGALGARSEHVVRSIAGGRSTAARLVTVARGTAADRQARALLRQADVVHYPFTVPVPRPPAGVPWIVTLLDVQHRDLPDMFSPLERLYRAVTYDAAARRASRVITISEFCRERIHANLGVPSARIDVAHLGVDHQTFAFHDGPREPFVFYPATAWPHKNHQRLLAAIELARRERPDLRLVLTGGQRDRLGPLPPWVEHRGHVPESEVAALYRSAACVVFPSLYEGFGLPLLEAMAAGCPVVAADSGALAETCGPVGILFDARAPEAIAAAIRSALGPDSSTVAKGVARAQMFTWAQCTAVHVTSFRRAQAH